MQVAANGRSIEVEVQGPADGPPLLLIMGVGMQLLGWPDGFVDLLAQRGFRVIRFDNRDVGLSDGHDAEGLPNLPLATFRYLLGLRIVAPYSLADMADDAAGVLDGLGIARAHVCACSMGGMIAQHLAVRHPKRLLSLTLMMTSSGARHLPRPALAVQRAFLARPKRPDDRLAAAEHYVRLFGIIGSPAYPTPADEARARAREFVERAFRPAGSARQMLAILADGDRTPLLGRIRAPTHIIHGAADPLVPVEAGRDLAGRIEGATLDVIDGMGHDLPRAMWERFAIGIEGAAARASAAPVPA